MFPKLDTVLIFRSKLATTQLTFWHKTVCFCYPKPLPIPFKGLCYVFSYKPHCVLLKVDLSEYYVNWIILQQYLMLTQKMFSDRCLAGTEIFLNSEKCGLYPYYYASSGLTIWLTSSASYMTLSVARSLAFVGAVWCHSSERLNGWARLLLGLSLPKLSDASNYPTMQMHPCPCFLHL